MFPGNEKSNESASSRQNRVISAALFGASLLSLIVSNICLQTCSGVLSMSSRRYSLRGLSFLSFAILSINSFVGIFMASKNAGFVGHRAMMNWGSLERKGTTSTQLTTNPHEFITI